MAKFIVSAARHPPNTRASSALASSALADPANGITDKNRRALLPRPQGVWLRQTPLAGLGVAPRFARRYAQRKAGIADDNDGREILDQLS
ncbi:hypothetical protein [Parasedimentitalea psychrophila]|uniref:Uncharacterized protein n=1 Tax=Parasedimentitalea psychrophila TaxID=2997337 RepID=A0A9Y2L3G4_9RHOB|nr:hypothetical protein [Parasedimentitalea psychrophila]WIY26976.1 hypothetical protein QPJ95_08710 [Parasedimentitalea psychrophila]